MDEANAGFLSIIAITSKSGGTPTLELGNFASTRVVDELRRVKGVGKVQAFSSEYAMRIWLDPQKLDSYKLSQSEALAAVQEQNSQTPGGQLGDQPLANGSEINATITTQSRFTTPEQFREIILRANPDGSAITLGDVARVELGVPELSLLHRAQRQADGCAGDPAHAGRQRPGHVRCDQGAMAELAKGFPQDIGWQMRSTRRPSSPSRWRRWSRP